MPQTNRQAIGKAKRERIEARTTAVVKARLQQAADLRGLSLSDFIILSAEQAAEEVIREYKIITLTEQDSQLFADALLNSREPNEKLQAAFVRHAAEVDSID